MLKDFLNPKKYKEPTVLRPTIPVLFAVSINKILEWYKIRASNDDRFKSCFKTGKGTLTASIGKYHDYDALLNHRTFLVEALHEVPPYKEFCEELKCQLNAYASRPDVTKFPLHYDEHHIFAIQSFGEKEWHIWEPDNNLTTNVHLPIPDTPPLIIKTNPGDVLFLPYGWRHFANTIQPSVHFSLGFSREP